MADKLRPDQAETFVRNLCAYADQVVFSAAVPGQGGFHANPQPLEYWVARFWGEGFAVELPLTLQLRHRWRRARAPDWLPRNVAVFVRSPVPAAIVDRDIQAAERVPGPHSALDLRLLYHEASRCPSGEAAVALGARAGRAVSAMGLGVHARRVRRRRGEATRVYAVDHHAGELTFSDSGQVSFDGTRTWDALVTNLRALRINHAVTPVLADAVEAAVTWEGPRVRLLVLDSARCEADINADLRAWHPHLAPGALVLFWGAHHDDVRRVMDRATEEGLVEHVMTLGGWGAARVPESHTAATAHPRPRRPSSRRRDRISLLMPARNEGARLKATVDSLLANTFYPDFELLVLDDASTDGSTDFLLSPAYYRDDRITLVRKRTWQGYVALWAEGAVRASGSILKFLDAHHCFEPYWLTALYDALARRGFRAIVGSVVGALDTDTWSLTQGTGLFGYTFENRLDNLRVVSFRECGPDGRVPWFAGHQMMMTRATFEALGGFFPFFEGHGTEDSDLCLRAFLLGIDCYVEPSSVLGHYYRSQHLNPVTYADIYLNMLMTTYLNFGRKYLETWYRDLEDNPAFREGKERMKARRAELECFRDWIVRRQARTPEELLEHLAHY